MSVSQPSYIYYGGISDGYAATTLATADSYLSKGAYGDGYSIGLFSGDLYFVLSGSTGDWYTSHVLLSEKLSLITGGKADGYSMSTAASPESYIVNGSIADGYDMSELKESFIWTGAIGTGWTVSGNWNYNIVPDITRPVIIQDGVPNWPYVNTGLFNIGDNPNTGTYKCASLWIQENAFLQTRVNCRVENCGLIQIDGEMRVKKITADAFQNFAPGVVIVDQGGELIIKP